MGYYFVRMPNPMHQSRYSNFRKLLLAERLRQGVTQVDLAKRLRKPQSYVSKFERAERRLDVIEFLDICQALGCDPHELLAKLMEEQ